MARNVYKTAQGQLVDIDNLRLVNESVIAVGNMGVNARGDRVTPNGTIIETRNQIMKRRYHPSATLISGPEEEYVPPTTPSKVVAQPAPAETETAPAAESAPTMRGTLASSVAPATVVPKDPLLSIEQPVTKVKRI